MGFVDSYGAFVGCVVGGVFVLLVSTYVVREVCYKRYGIDVCPGAAGSLGRARQRRQEMLDEQTAMQVQQAMEEEDRRHASIQRREERRAKYEVFLKPYTMVIRQEDFFVPSQQSNLTSTGDIETGSSADPGCTDEQKVPAISVPQHTEAEDRHVMLTLPVTTKDGEPRRVEASCSICLMEYQVGESVIWSTRKKCPHAFHDECILTWLGKGKKRCPCCRHFFVPGKPVDGKPSVVDDGADESINGESDGENMEDAAMDAAIIEEIRNAIHAGVDCENGASPSRSRRSSAYEPRRASVAESIVTINTI